jgi:hypothetical protein
MITKGRTPPVEDSVPMVNNEIAVGENLDFQRKWWRFSKGLWIVFGLMVLADLIGCFGRGPISHASAAANDGSITMNYDWVERFSTPCILRVSFGPNAVHEGKAQLWTSKSLEMPLGNQRIIPEPESSALHDGGILYTFPVKALPATIEFSLQPADPGLNTLLMRVPGHEAVKRHIFVMP